MLVTLPVADISMVEIAHRAGISKGALYLYFSTKEALFLALTETALERWRAAVASVMPEKCDQELLCHLLAEELERSSPALPSLLAVLHTTLEHNIEDEEVRRFKYFLKDLVTDLGARMERATGWEAGTGVRLLLRLHVCIIGSSHVANPSPAVRRALEDDELALFRLDFSSLMRDLLPLVVRPHSGGKTSV
jgi:AcrR family transcriptional regulator